MQEYLRQHNALTEARYDMSALEKDIFYLLMRQVKQEDDPYKEYIVHTDQSEALKKATIQELREAARNLLTRVYYIEKPNGDLLAVALMTMVSYDESDRNLRIVISYKLLPYLVALRKDFTEFQLKVALDLKSKYAKRLYEILSQHKEAGKFHITIQELKWRLALNDLKTGIEQYAGWSNFKRAILEGPQKELSKKAEISFQYRASKTGKKYTHLEFEIVKNKRAKLERELWQIEGKIVNPS